MGTYRLYGLNVRSSLALPCTRVRGPGPADVTLVVRRRMRPRGRQRSDRAEDWFRWRRLSDDSLHLVWRNLFEFFVSPDGRSIASQPYQAAHGEALLNYLLSQVLSFSLLALGREPLHASAVAVDGGVVAFLGDCGAGKSSLSATFIRAGYPLVTDDLMVLGPVEADALVQPGLPRIKLFPGMARRILPAVTAMARMNPGTSKLIMRLGARDFCATPLPLRALYVLHRSRGSRAGSPRIRRLAGKAAFFAIVGATFNSIVTGHVRAARQFQFARRLVATVPVRRITYSNRFQNLPDVRDQVLRDLAGSGDPRRSGST